MPVRSRLHPKSVTDTVRLRMCRFHDHRCGCGRHHDCLVVTRKNNTSGRAEEQGDDAGQKQSFFHALFFSISNASSGFGPGDGECRVVLQTCRRILQFPKLASCIIHALSGKLDLKNPAHLQLEMIHKNEREYAHFNCDCNRGDFDLRHLATVAVTATADTGSQ
jgi:hypothetical protein